MYTLHVTVTSNDQYVDLSLKCDERLSIYVRQLLAMSEELTPCDALIFRIEDDSGKTVFRVRYHYQDGLTVNCDPDYLHIQAAVHTWLYANLR